MNTKFEMNVATLVRPDGITAVHDGYPTSGERDEILLQNVAIGRVTRGKINRSIAERGCETARDALKVVQYFAAGDERAIRKIERAAEIPDQPPSPKTQSQNGRDTTHSGAPALTSSAASRPSWPGASGARSAGSAS